jgi:hypothetical protein
MGRVCAGVLFLFPVAACQVRQKDEEVVMTKKQAIQKSISHWTRMIAWAKKQPQLDFSSADDMNKSIGEMWGGQYCSLCDLYLRERLCVGCPLDEKTGGCCCIEWRTITHSRNWDEWVKNAKILLKKLKGFHHA